jgi:ABC-type polar amino acid transport system ATPase subunit
MLFDEPTSALDPEMIKEVLDVMIEWPTRASP